MSYTIEKLELLDAGLDAVDRNCVLRYIILSTTDNDIDFNSAINATDMPNLGSTYPHDTGLFLKDKKVSEWNPLSSGTRFIVDCSYVTSRKGGITDESIDPLSAPPRISFSTARYRVVMSKAYATGDPASTPSVNVLNSAGLQFDPPLTKEIANTLMSLTYNTRTWDFSYVSKYINKLNKDQLKITNTPIQAKHARINDLNADDNYDANGNIYWTVSIQIEISDKEFNTQVLDAGLMAKKSGGTIPENIYLETATNGTVTKLVRSEISGFTAKLKAGSVELVNEPQLLNGSGNLLGVGGTPVYGTYQGNPAVSWASLNLPKIFNTSRNDNLGGLPSLSGNAYRPSGIIL